MRSVFHLLFRALVLTAVVALLAGFFWHPDSGLAGGPVLTESKVPTPCDPWKDSCPGGSLYCFTLGPLTCYCAKSPCLTD